MTLRCAGGKWLDLVAEADLRLTKFTTNSPASIGTQMFIDRASDSVLSLDTTARFTAETRLD